MGTPTDIKGFHVLKVQLPESSGTHYVYFRKHEAKGNQAAQSISGRSLFMFNPPIETDAAVLRKYFQQVAIGATVEKYIPSLLNESEEEFYVDLTKLTTDLEYEVSGADIKDIASKLPKNCGIVTFLDKSSLQLAFNSLKKLSADAKSSKWPASTLGTEYLQGRISSRVFDAEKLSQEVSADLEAFNRAEKESRETLQQQSEIVDEDGFTLVVGSHSKTKAGIMGKQSKLQRVEQEKAKKKSKRKEKEDFYRFQLREKKKNEMNDLLSKFKQDQERIKMMKEKKRFRPY